MTRGSSAPASRFTNRWLRSATHEDWGLGFCKGIRGADLILSYVDIPDVAEHEVLVPLSDVIDKPIPKGTRVWVPGKPYGWHAGVIQDPASANRYQVSLVGDGPQLPLLYQFQFKIRWSIPLEDPARAIAHGLTEAPTFYEARSALLSELVQQRRACRGLSAAISAPINLFQHQVDTAARVLSDPVMRYLLADEVGLGKTIEAGIVVRQLLTENADATVLVLCPNGLVGQWTSELRDRLGLDAALQGPQLTVAPLESVDRIAASHPAGLARYDLVIVDEAHHLVRHLDAGSDLEAQFRCLDGFVALSATPMRGDLETFRRLLALIDPVAFEGTDAQSFRARIDERERSAGDVQVLSTRRASLRQKAAVLASIEADFPNDENIRNLAEACRRTDDPQDHAWTDLANYVREIYRISRRMIRHHRNSELVQEYAVAGRTPTFIEFEDPARTVVDEFLEKYRLRMIDARTYAAAVLHGLAGPTALRDYLKRRSDEDDGVLFEMTIARLEMAGLDARLRAAADVVRQRVDDGRRVVVASSFPGVIRRFEELLQDSIDEDITHAHYLSMTPADRDVAVADFLSIAGGAVLLADRSMEEGRNLQEAEVLVNLDLPLDANRLDQRIGRLDRYAVRPEPAEVVVLTEPGSAWVSAHIELLQDGIGVFDASVSTVQRLLSVVLSDVVGHLVEGGVDALKVDFAALRAELEIERDNIDLLEELESVESATVFNDEAFDELLDYEIDVDGLRKALRRLTTGTGSIALRPVESPLGVLSFGNARGIGLSADDAESLEGLLRPKALDREISVKQRGVAPFRIGDPLVDWLHDYLLSDERGRASAVVRPLVGITVPTLWLHSEFLVEFNPQHAPVPSGPDHARLSRRGESHLQPLRLETWTDASGPAPQDLVDGVLSRPFDGHRDKILRGGMWKPVLQAIPDWARQCTASADAAWEQVRSSARLAEALCSALASTTADSDRRVAILEARSVRLPSGPERESARIELESERAAARSLAEGISDPRIRLVTCGACVVWPEDDF